MIFDSIAHKLVASHPHVILSLRGRRFPLNLSPQLGKAGDTHVPMCLGPCLSPPTENHKHVHLCVCEREGRQGGERGDGEGGEETEREGEERVGGGVGRGDKKGKKQKTKQHETRPGSLSSTVVNDQGR